MKIALFPGNFSVFHDGHYSIVKKALESDPEMKVMIILSRGERDKIKKEDSLNLVKEIFKPDLDKKVKVILSPVESPIRFCYDLCSQTSTPIEFYMVSSNKDGDDARIRAFIEAFSENGKFHNENAIVKRLDIDLSPIKYEGRFDGLNGEFISGTQARKDLSDFDKFKSNFINILKYNHNAYGSIEKFFEKYKKSPILESLSDESIPPYNECKLWNGINYDEYLKSFK